jgi:hypothetical protein
MRYIIFGAFNDTVPRESLDQFAGPLACHTESLGKAFLGNGEIIHVGQLFA